MGTSLLGTQVVRFSPAGLSDSLDETDLFPGACSVLQNLIPDPSTKNVWTCRPAAASMTAFSGFTTPGTVSVFKVVGNLVYGMIGSALFSGKDQPFVYNIATGTFVTVLGMNSSNLPATQSTTGDWVPPTMDLVGVNMVVTHPGFDGVNYFFGWFDTTNPAAPVWHAGNLAGTGSIEALGSITGGSSYTNGTYTDVALTIFSGTAGTGATADIVVAGGAVSSVSIRKWGTGYDTTSVLTATAASIGGTGSGFHVPVTAVYAGKIQLTSVPSWVAQFNGRAWFGINPATGQPSTPFTDSLLLTCSNANQALTYGDNLQLTAAKGLPLDNQLGGVIQALLIFKGQTQIYQVTGDYTGSTLAVNTLNAATGTLSPRSICDTPNGVAFLAADGVRVIDFTAHVGEPLGAAGSGVTVPFLSPLYPSRVAAACSVGVLRISVQNSTVGGTPFQEYWFDNVRGCWSGPHTLPASMLDVYQNSFVVAAVGVPAQLFLSATVPNFVSSTVENGNQLTWVFQTTVLRDNEDMSTSELVELQVKTSRVIGVPSMQATAQDENASVYATTSYFFSVSGSYFGAAVFGSAVWGGGNKALHPAKIMFPTPVVYDRLAIRLTGASAQGFQIGDLFLRRRELNYTQSVA